MVRKAECEKNERLGAGAGGAVDVVRCLGSRSGRLSVGSRVGSSVRDILV